MVRWVYIPFIVLFATGGCDWLRNGGEPARRNVVLVVIDTLRADHLSSYGYERETSPILDAFAAENLRFEYAMATAPWTPPSVASIFTGLYPTAHGVIRHAKKDRVAEARKRAAVLDDRFVTLAEALRNRGYRTVGITGNAWVADYLGFAQGFDDFSTLDYEPANVVNRYAFAALEPLAAADQPFFLYVHYMDPHTPYKPPAGHRGLFREPLRQAAHDEQQRNRIDLYDGEIHYLDSEIGRLFERLRELRLYDEAVIVVVSDHGEQFKEHGKTGHGHNVFNYQIHVPLLLKAPRRSARVADVVSTCDIYPTLLELTATKGGGTPHCVSLLTPDETRAGVLSEATRTGNLKAFTRRDGKKMILDFSAKHRRPSAPPQQHVGLFDIRSDYSESSSLPDAELATALERRLVDTHRDALALRSAAESPQAELSDETVRRLEALGYLE